MPTPLRRARLYLLALCVLLASAGCAHLPGSQLDAARFTDIDTAINDMIAAHGMPGASYWLERNGASYQKAYGKQNFDADAAPVTLDTLFDAASLSKVLATAPSIILLAERGKIDLDAPLIRYFPECANGGKEGITIRHLLTHSSGMPASLPGKPAWRGGATALAMACKQVVTNPPGTLFRYSDINYVLLGQLVQKASGLPLDEFARLNLYEPLKMQHTGYLPLLRFPAAQIAPTQKLTGPEAGNSLHTDLAAAQELRGVVHDPTARYMDGVGGSAGVFTTAGDLARFARMMVNGGELDGVRIFSPASMRLLTSVQSPEGLARRSLGWDIDSPFARPRGAIFPIGSYGHTGFTGCIVWIDPFSKTFYVFLSNRVYPNDKSNILPLYSVLGTLAARSAAGFDFSAVTGALAPTPATIKFAQ